MTVLHILGCSRKSLGPDAEIEEDDTTDEQNSAHVPDVHTQHYTVGITVLVASMLYGVCNCRAVASKRWEVMRQYHLPISLLVSKSLGYL